jgi:hypothetical protein
MLRIFLVAALALSCSGSLTAQWMQDGKPMAETSWSKADGELAAMLHLTDNPEKLFADWETESAGVSFSGAELTKRGEVIGGVVVFRGCAPSEKGFCNLTATYTLFKPDGTVYDEPVEAEVWIDKPPPPRNDLQLGMGSYCVVIEPGDPLGRYRMQAEVRDHVAGKTIRLERHFDAVEVP